MERYVVHVTKRCNLDCFYCYEDDKSSIYSWKEIKYFIDEIIKYAKEPFSIEFLGGEPCLETGLMLKAINYFKQKTNLIDSFGITTNGTIVDTNLLQILKENKNVYIGISLDGTKNMNQFRVFKNTKDNSYDKVIESIEVLKENGFIDRISIHIVTHLYNVYLLHHGIKHLQSLGIKRIGVGTIEKTMEIDDMYVKTFVSEFKKISKDIAKGIITVHIDLLDYLKPKSDVRHYIYDKGKIVGESYGRAKDDITNNKNNFNIIAPGSPFSDMIYNLRETVYNNHKQILLKEQKRKEFYKLCNIIKGKTS